MRFLLELYLAILIITVSLTAGFAQGWEYREAYEVRYETNQERAISEELEVQQGIDIITRARDSHLYLLSHPEGWTEPVPGWDKQWIEDYGIVIKLLERLK